MRIIVVGAGAVGSYLAERLSGEGQDVVMIESDSARSAEMQEALDALVITGNGASRTILEEAGVDRSDLLIAVSSNDGANILACHAASQLGVKRTVARVEDPGLRSGLGALGVDVVIDPGMSAASELVGLVQHEGISDLVEFGRGQLVLAGGIAQSGAPLIGGTLAELRLTEAGGDWIAVAVVRDGQTIVAHGDTKVLEGDHVLIMVTAPDVEEVRDLLGLHSHPVRRVVISGSTRIAEATAELMLDEGFDVAMIDPDSGRCRSIAERHAGVLVTHGDPTDPAILRELQISHDDAFLGLSGWDEINLLSCLVAKALGASTVVARVNRISYVGLLSGVGIDAAVSARIAAANEILRFVRRGRIHSVATFKDTDAEAIEIEVTSDSKAVGNTLQDIGFPRNTVVGGILRDGDALVPRGSTEIRERDHLIIFALPEAIPDVERLLTA